MSYDYEELFKRQGSITLPTYAIRSPSSMSTRSPSPDRMFAEQKQRSTTPGLDGPAGTRYLNKEKMAEKHQEEAPKTLFVELKDSRRVPGFTGYIPGVAAESIYGKSYGNITNNRRELVREVKVPERSWTSINRSEYVDRSDGSEATKMLQDEQAVEDSKLYLKNIPRNWRTLPNFDIVKAVNAAAPLGAKMGYQWADPKKVPKMTMRECKLFLREKISQRVPTGGHFLRRGFGFFSIGTKYVTFEKFCAALQGFGLFSVFTHATVADLFAFIDKDEDGIIQLREFVDAFLDVTDDNDELFDRRMQPQ